MEYRALGPLRVSVLGVGGLHFGVFQDEAASQRVILAALDLGINLIDTAPTYGQGQSEAIIGRALGQRRHEAVIATKVGLTSVPPHNGVFQARVDRMTPCYIRERLEGSLRALGTDYIDLYQLHAPPRGTMAEALATLELLVKEGKVRAFGCANFNAEELALARRLAPSLVSLQVQYSMIDRHGEQKVIPLCRQHQIGVLCNRILARGILSGEYRPKMPFPPGSRAALSSRLSQELRRHPARLTLALALATFARDRGHTGIDLAIAWLLRQPGITTAVLGMTDEAQVQANIKAAQWALTDQDMADIDALIDGMWLLDYVRHSPWLFFER